LKGLSFFPVINRQRITKLDDFFSFFPHSALSQVSLRIAPFPLFLPLCDCGSLQRYDPSLLPRIPTLFIPFFVHVVWSVMRQSLPLVFFAHILTVPVKVPPHCRPGKVKYAFPLRALVNIGLRVFFSFFQVSFFSPPSKLFFCSFFLRLAHLAPHFLSQSSCREMISFVFEQTAFFPLLLCTCLFLLGCTHGAPQDISTRVKKEDQVFNPCSYVPCVSSSPSFDMSIVV